MSQVLFVNHVSQVSGAERGLLNMVASIAPTHSTAGVVLPSPGPLVDQLEARSIPITYLPLRRFQRRPGPLAAVRNLLSVVHVAARLARLLRARRVDIVHANSNQAQVYAGPAARLAGVHSVWHCRDLVPLGLPGKWMGRLATRVVTTSSAVDGLVATCVPDPAKRTLIHNAVDLKQFRPGNGNPAWRRELDLPPGAFLVGMVGQLIPWKEHPVFLRAAATIAETLPAAHFLVVGDDMFNDHPGYRTELELLAQCPLLKGRVTFTGYRAGIPAILDGLDLLIHPASKEPFGRVVLEAMATAKPVIAVDACGPAEIIRSGEDGILVPPQDADAIARAALQLASDPALARRIGQEARRRVESHFSLSRLAGRLEALYEEVLCA